MDGRPPPGPLWRAIDKLGPGRIEAFLEAEFPALHAMGAVNRRDLMRLMGASLALAGLAGCDRGPSGRPLLSQARDAEAHVQGKPLYFATSLALDGYGRGVLVKSQDGRPIKIEGNPLHPASLGATDVFMQADVLSLYDPDRSGAPWSGGRPRPWSELRRFLIGQRQELTRTGGEGLHILIGATSSPTVAGLIKRLRSLYPAARVHSWSPIDDPLRPPPGLVEPAENIHHFDHADGVLSLGADFLGVGPAQVRHAQDWAARRRRGIEQGRLPALWVAETTLLLTGAQAENRIALPPDGIEALARAVAAELGIAEGGGTHPRAAEIARGLAAAGPAALVVAGRGQSPATGALARRINQHLGAIGTTLSTVASVRLGRAEGIESLAALAREMAAGRVRRLVILDCNPAYDAPSDLRFGELLARVPVSLHLGFHRDETARLCGWHVPRRHPLESWGDLRAFDGTVGLVQPATVPLVEALSTVELLALVVGERPDGRTLVRRQWRALSDADWLKALEAGVIPGTQSPPVQVTTVAVPPRQEGGAEGDRLTLTFAPDDRLWDGGPANNAWLQELPSPLTKLVWGNAALIGPATAERLGFGTGDLVEIAHRGAAVRAPVWIMPGQASGTVTLALGYGRPFAGRVGSGVGVDAFPLRTGDAPWAASISIRKVPGEGRVISTQDHHPIPDPGAIRVVRQAELAAPVEPPTDRPSLYPDFASVGHAWGMAIDLDACIGCGACTIACQAENNIPVVGPDEVERGREMHWIRVDRYHSGPAEMPETLFQPVPCMHCEKAPCEVVCPVAATVHSSEGLNQMVYNRCIGTRTCSNNCPYKVRRFNWFDYQEQGVPVPAPVHNPRVTVRERGVMEKCTYCVQRINAARAEATVEGRAIGGDEIMTACQQACPTEAIVFGDLADPDSAVSRLKRSGRNYALLGDLDTRPRTSYLARVKR